jgi:RNA polymerase sigma-70 factor (ECF subfamily)
MGAAEKRETFEQTVLPHLNAAYNLARWMTRSGPDAEDIVQEAYLRAFRFYDGFRGGDGKLWLLAIVRNTCLTWRQREGRMAKVVFDEEAHGGRETAESAEGELVAKGNFAQLRNCMELLAREYRETIVMRELEEMPYRDIAEALSVPIGTVMSRLARARKQLQDCIAARTKGAGK